MDYNIFTRYTNRQKSHKMSPMSGRFKPERTDFKTAFNEKIKTNDNVIYINIPFCNKICSFCNMNRKHSKNLDDYEKLLIKNIEVIGKTEAAKSTTIESIYFGGGTPTVLSSKSLVNILQALKKNFNLNNTCEISIESTISELTPEKLSILMENGVNRISVGIQSFTEKGRKFFKRQGDPEFAMQRIKDYLDLGFKGVNIDIIYNYPGQTLEDLQYDIDIISKLDIAGFSFYSLVIGDDSNLNNILNDKDKAEINDVNRDFSFFDKLTTECKKNGYEFFELTKMIKPGRDEYKYIKQRYKQKTTFPIGAGAGGRINTSLIRNPVDIEEYRQLLNDFDNQKTIKYTEDYLKFNLALRTIQFGYIDLNLYPLRLKERIFEFCKSLKKDNLVIQKGEIFLLNQLGIFWGNNIEAELEEYLNEIW